MRSLRAIAAILPSVGRAFALREGRQGRATEMVSGHAASFDWGYQLIQPEIDALYGRAKRNQWNADQVLDWSTEVNPLSDQGPLQAVKVSYPGRGPGGVESARASSGGDAASTASSAIQVPSGGEEASGCSALPSTAAVARSTVDYQLSTSSRAAHSNLLYS